MQRLNVLEALSFCLKQGVAFYAYRLPGEEKMCFGAQVEGEVERLQSVEERVGKVGFVAVPFREDEGNEPLFLRGDVCFTEVLEEPETLSRLQKVGRGRREKMGPVDGCGREKYDRQVTEVIGALRRKEAQKAVLARGIVVEADAYSNASRWFEALAERYPESFVFIVSVPGVMTWMGATPEILLKQESHEVVTMSLAGTRKAGCVGTWGEKELEEQRIVTEYIAGILNDFGDWKMDGPFTKRAARVEHLCTMFRRAGVLSFDAVEGLRRRLHPTPAVGGYPLKEALEIIRRAEGQHRRYYAGYVGPWWGNGCFQWFVNLRSMELFSNAVRLYIGGGITAQSDAEKEWEETVMKSRTLMEVIMDDF